MSAEGGSDHLPTLERIFPDFLSGEYPQPPAVYPNPQCMSRRQFLKLLAGGVPVIGALALSSCRDGVIPTCRGPVAARDLWEWWNRKGYGDPLVYRQKNSRQLAIEVIAADYNREECGQ